MDKYSSGLVSESFWFIECKKIIKLKYDSFSWDDVQTMCISENFLGIPKEYRAKRIFGYIKNRITLLDEKTIKLFLEGDISTQKIIVLLAIAKKNRLFYEFLYEVYREKVILRANELKASDITVFFKNKQEQNDDIAKWTDVTLKRLRSTYMNFLADAGFLAVKEKKKILTPPIIGASLEDHLKDIGETTLLKAVTGVN
ncbi:MAG: DUF1819 family protein [Eubacteriaceae bacterium]